MFAGLVVAALFAGAAGALTAAPAEAYEFNPGINYPCDLPGACSPGGGGGCEDVCFPTEGPCQSGTGVGVTKHCTLEGGGGGGIEIGAYNLLIAIGYAENALAGPGCNAFASNGTVEAFDTQQNTQIVDRRDQSITTNDLIKFASVRASDIGSGGGNVGGITTYREFYDDEKITAYRDRARQNAIFANATNGWNLNQWRALMLIHETAHLTGKLPANHAGGPWANEGHTEADHSLAFDRYLVTSGCVPR